MADMGTTDIEVHITILHPFSIVDTAARHCPQDLLDKMVGLVVCPTLGLRPNPKPAAAKIKWGRM